MTAIVIPFTPHSPVVKTPGFGPGDPGSTPGAASIVLILPSVRIERDGLWDMMPSDCAPYEAPSSDPA